MQQSPEAMLAEAIDRNLAAILSLPTDGLMRNVKSRLIGGSADQGLWLELDPTQAGIVDHLISAGKNVGVAFKTTQLKVVFATKLLERKADYRINATSVIEAARVEYPAQMKVVQRRGGYRVNVAADADAFLSAWRITDQAELRDEPLASLRVLATLRDISASGMGIILPRNEDGKFSLIVGQRLRVQIAYEELSALLEGRVKHIRPNPDGSSRVGVEFQKLDACLENRQAAARLNTMVARLHQLELKRAKAA